MKRVLYWFKDNIIIVICVIVALGAIGGLVVVKFRGDDFTDTIGKRLGKITEIDHLGGTAIEIPPELPDNPTRKLTIAVNQIAIDEISDVYNRMHSEANGIFSFAVGFNKQNHLPMIDGLFPEPSEGTAKTFVARQRYQFSFADMLEPFSSSAGYPQLDAKTSMPVGDLTKAVDKVTSDFLNNFLPPRTLAELTPTELETLNDRKRKKTIETLLNYARGTHVYVTRTTPGPGYPFDVGAWSSASSKPQDEELWEGQMDLWVQQDIARAIMYTNLISTPNTNVLNVPVKRLLGIRVVPGYVGLGSNVRGGLGGFPELSSAGPSSYSSTVFAGGPSAGALAESAIANDFVDTPTGRISNAIYDVKHAYVSIIVDVQRLPEFFDNLAQVNFMTVVKMEVSDVDEYKDAKENYIYGAGADCVRVDLVVESIWLRKWTKIMMPQKVRDALGVPKPGVGDDT